MVSIIYMNNVMFEDIDLKEVPRVVIDIENDSVIQSFIHDSKSNVDCYLKLKEEDVESIFNTKGQVSTISGKGNGENAVTESMKSLINNFVSYQDIRTILIRFYIHETFPVMKFQTSLDYIYEVFEKEEEIIISILIDNILPKDCVQSTSIIKQNVFINEDKNRK